MITQHTGIQGQWTANFAQSLKRRFEDFAQMPLALPDLTRNALRPQVILQSLFRLDYGSNIVSKR
jgi:hypothetical protein